MHANINPMKAAVAILVSGFRKKVFPGKRKEAAKHKVIKLTMI